MFKLTKIAANIAGRSWCKYLKSVEYLGFADNDSRNSDSTTIPLRESKWTVAVKGLRFR